MKKNTFRFIKFNPSWTDTYNFTYANHKVE